AAFADCLSQPAFSVGDTTFCIWRQYGDAGWQRGAIEFPPGHPDPDGSGPMLALLDGHPETYQAFAKRYFAKAAGLGVALVCQVHGHRPLTEEFVRWLNPERLLGDLEADLREIGYPSDEGGHAEPGAAPDFGGR